MTLSDQRCRKGYRSIVVMLGMFLLFMLWPQSVLAKGSARITWCRMETGTRLAVTASCEPATVTGDKCYLFALPFEGGKITSKTKPLAQHSKASFMSFKATVPKSKRTTLLYSRYVLAEKVSGKYRIISNARYIANPGMTAKRKYEFPTATSKKGLQVSGSMVEDAVELNVQHSVLNIVLSWLPVYGSSQNRNSAIPYKYGGKTYWMNRGVVESYDRQLETLKINNAVVSAVLLLDYTPANAGLIHPQARKRGYAYYAWNLTSEKSRQTFQAIISFLAERYSAKNGSHGRIVNWIVGNEVETPAHWNYSGGMPLRTYMANYARQFRLVYTAVTSAYANARVYISLGHLWNMSQAGGFTGRETLTAFASAISSQGYIPWNLAYHPYSSPLTEPKFWENKNRMLTAAITSPVINMGNLSVLTNYIRSKYGSATRIILSEQGFTSVQSGKNVQAEQSAAIAYSYLLTEADDMVDSFIMNRHVDHTAETSQGLNLGLWTTSGAEWADKKKDSWTLFKYMDTGMSEKFTKAALTVLDVKRWSDLIANYSPVLYRKVNLIEGKLQIVGGFKAAKSIASKWKSYGAAGRFTKKKNTYTVWRDNSRNRNCQWGFMQAFGKPLNMSARPVFGTSLKVSGAQSQNVLVKMRFYSGRNEYDLSQVIPGGKKVILAADLTGWASVAGVTRVLITVEPISGGWRGDASIVMTRPAMGNR